MNLKTILEQCIKNGRLMTQQVAMTQFGNDSPDAREITRRFGITDTAKLVGVSETTIRNAEKAQKLPAPDVVQSGRVERREGYTIKQIDMMREVFGTRPVRPEGSEPVVVAVTVNKGGAYKTSTSVHLAQWLALQGWRTLLVDADPQATASLYHGYVPDLHIKGEETLLPFMLGERSDLEYAIKPTCWPQLDIIPSCLELHRIESEVMARHDANELGGIPPHMMLRAGIESVYNAYDIVVIDGAPHLGTGPINIVCAADVLVVPTPAEMYDYVSSTQFFLMLYSLIGDIDLNGFEPNVKILVTKYSNSVGSQSEWMLEQIRKTWGDLVLTQVVKSTDEVGKGQIRMRTVFEQAADQRSSISAWRNAVAIWEPVASEIFDRLIKTRWGV